MVLILHQVPASPPVRAVKLCLAELGLKAEYKLLNLSEKEQLGTDYQKKNPQHTVPTLEDGDFIIWESHAINGYLVSKYGKNDSLYPKDPKSRALVDQRLHFDTGVLFPALRNIVVKLFYQNQKVIIDEDIKKVQDAFEFLEKFLEGRKFTCGDSFTIADFSIYTNMTIGVVLVPELDKYPKIVKYLELCKQSFKGIEDDKIGFDAFKDRFDKCR